MIRLRQVLALVAAIILGQVAAANAATITFKATDLLNINPAQDLWRYDYMVSGFVFSADQGFSVYFSPSLYADLESPPPAVNADWDIVSFPTDPLLPADGIYDALALVNGASLSQAFTVTFRWLGAPGTLPGAQPFTINQFDVNGSLSFLETGRSSPVNTAVPEPTTMLLLVSGIAIGSVRRRRTLSR